jgi:integrative and conjugative element protein (TIGR02256 family)
LNSIFTLSKTQKLIVVENVIKCFESFRQIQWWNKESGGVLLGRHLDDTDDIVVDEITIPQRSDLGRRYSFFRSKKHQELAHQRWKEESHTLAYLGLWHTHPQQDPIPSRVDIYDWSQAISNDNFHGERLFFPIVGTNRIRVWTMDRSGILQQLHQESI